MLAVASFAGEGTPFFGILPPSVIFGKEVISKSSTHPLLQRTIKGDYSSKILFANAPHYYYNWVLRVG